MSNTDRTSEQWAEFVLELHRAVLKCIADLLRIAWEISNSRLTMVFSIVLGTLVHIKPGCAVYMRRWKVCYTTINGLGTCQRSRHLGHISYANGAALAHRIRRLCPLFFRSLDNLLVLAITIHSPFPKEDELDRRKKESTAMKRFASKLFNTSSLPSSEPTTETCPACGEPLSSRRVHSRWRNAIRLLKPWAKRTSESDAPTTRTEISATASSRCDSCRQSRSSIAPTRPTINELNPMFRVAEQWHRPPSHLFEGLSLKMPVLEAGE